MGKILLGADRESILHPGLIGLDDVQLDSMDWLVPVADASKARECAREAARNDGTMESGRIDEAWIRVSSDDVSAINLAAALRADNGMLPVYLVAASPSGSDISLGIPSGPDGHAVAAGVLREVPFRKAQAVCSEGPHTARSAQAGAAHSSEEGHGGVRAVGDERKRRRGQERGRRHRCVHVQPARLQDGGDRLRPSVRRHGPLSREGPFDKHRRRT